MTSTHRPEPPCWGMEGVPLFPPEWKRSLPQLPLPVIDRRTRQKRYSAFIDRFCAVGWFEQVTWTEAPARVAARMLDEIIASTPNTTFLDRPALTGRIETMKSARSLPLLVSTWEAIESLGLSDPELMAFLNDSTVLELHQRLGSSMAALDVTMTSRSWTSLSGNRRLSVHSASLPIDVETAFSIARRRHILQAGFVDGGTSADALWIEMLGGRAGLHPSGELTLDEAGALADITGERVRQISKRYELDHRLLRRWPVPDFLEQAARLIESATNLPVATAGEALVKQGFASAPVNVNAVIDLLARFGRCDRLRVVAGRIRPSSDGTFAGGLKTRAIVSPVWQLSEQTGIVREDEAVRHLESLFPQVASDELRSLLREACIVTDLPLGYLVLRRRGVPAITTSRKMLRFAGELPIQALSVGIERRSRYGGLPLPPPLGVLRAIFEAHPDFEISNDVVRLRTPGPPRPHTTIDWVIDVIRGSGLNVAARAVLLDAARQAGIKQGTVGVYCSFHELLVITSNGCIAAVGDEYGPEQLALAAQLAAVIQVPTDVDVVRLPGNGVRLIVLVGNDFRNSGSLPGKQNLLRRIGDRRLSILVNDDPHGTTGVSSGKWLFGYATALQTLGVAPGDTITIDLDFDALTATVALFDGGDDAGIEDDDAE